VNNRQKQLLKEHFQELASASEEEPEEEGASSMEEQSDDDRGQRQVGCSVPFMACCSMHQYTRA
jgi:hypothetical protein